MPYASFIRIILRNRLEQEGIQFQFNTGVKKVESVNGTIKVHGEDSIEKKPIVIEGDAILISVGRRANISGLDLEAAGIERPEAHPEGQDHHGPLCVHRVQHLYRLPHLCRGLPNRLH